MQSPPTSSPMVLQGRGLAIVATLVVPSLITGYGVAMGHAQGVVVAALIIWGTGTVLWLRRVWPRLELSRATGGDPRSGGAR
jgi:hypothetical protein